MRIKSCIFKLICQWRNPFLARQSWKTARRGIVEGMREARFESCDPRLGDSGWRSDGVPRPLISSESWRALATRSRSAITFHRCQHYLAREFPFGFPRWFQ
jgi:hypothetical protein